MVEASMEEVGRDVAIGAGEALVEGDSVRPVSYTHLAMEALCSSQVKSVGLDCLSPDFMSILCRSAFS